MKNQLQRCFYAFEIRVMKSEIRTLILLSLIALQYLYKFAQDPRERGYSFGMWCNKPRQDASRCIRRKLFCKEVIEEDSIFSSQASRAGYRHGYGFSHADCFPPSSCFRCLTSFSVAGLLIQSSSSLAILFAMRIILQIFPLFRIVVERAWRRVSHSVHVKRKTRRSTCVRTDWYGSNIRPKNSVQRDSARKGSL